MTSASDIIWRITWPDFAHIPRKDLQSDAFHADETDVAMGKSIGISAGAATATAGTLIDRRRGYRQPLRAAATLRPVTAGEQQEIPVHVFELSMSGVGFSAEVPLEIGTIHHFDLGTPRQSPRRAEIRSFRSRPDGMFDIGAQFC